MAALANIALPDSLQDQLRGVNLAGVLQGHVPSSAQRDRALLWRGGGGAPPCWNRSPPLAMRQGDWKLLFAPRPLSASPHTPGAFRVELYNVSVLALAENAGAFLEANNEAKYQPGVVERMMSHAMMWHNHTPCPFGHVNNSRRGVCTWLEIPFPGCEGYPFPGQPQRTCRGKPCPPAGHSGPCVCPPRSLDSYTSYSRLLLD